VLGSEHCAHEVPVLRRVLRRHCRKLQAAELPSAAARAARAARAVILAPAVAAAATAAAAAAIVAAAARFGL
jgi:hypothetical protein